MNTDKIYAEAIANDYSVKNTTKVVQLKKLDHRAKLPARLFGYSFGIFWTLVFGTGMCLAMGVIGGSWGWVAMLVGCIIGVLGIIGMSVNYPIYRAIMKRGKAKYAGDIIQLANEITNA